jgi:hypothetical protein
MPDTIIPDAADQTVTVTKAHGFVVVAWWADRHGADRKGSFDYTFHKTLNAALDDYNEYLQGEYQRATGMGVFATDAAGLPIRRLDPTRLMKLIAETRAA